MPKYRVGIVTGLRVSIRKSDALMFPSLGVYLYPWSRKTESGESEEYCTYHSPKTLLNHVKEIF